uniref:Uncharacterized protein n=1 Tax=Arundo donax TaxID=35708 RepID=A0A0A9A2C2_ARUDO
MYHDPSTKQIKRVVNLARDHRVRHMKNSRASRPQSKRTCMPRQCSQMCSTLKMPVNNSSNPCSSFDY